MKIVFHKKFSSAEYASNGASVPGRMEGIMEALEGEGHYEVVSPGSASYQDIVRVHSRSYVDGIAKDAALFEMASLAAGGAIRASEIALKNEPAFACIRPPGHHASKDSGWGYCVFCNVGIALLKLKSEGRIHSAFILDFDAHTGDGNIDVLSEWKEAIVLNPMAENSKDYLKRIEEVISDIRYVDLVAVSAGFDTYKKDLGKKLATLDFYLIGRLLRQFTKRMGHRRRFAGLEGGYYLPDLGKNVLAFCQGFE